MFGPKVDPKDAQISDLKEQVDYLRKENTDLRKELIAALNPHALRVAHPDLAPPPSKPAQPTPAEQRHMVHTPTVSLEKLEQAARGGFIS